VHCHDDFGLATGNAVAALDAGASWADGCLLGGGERAGTARSEALCAWLTVHGGHAYRLEHLPGLCRKAALALGRRIPAHAPVVGEGIWRAASGLHVDGLAKAAASYEPFDPGLVGASRSLLLGSQSGRGAVRAACLEQGLLPDAQACDRLLELLRRQSRPVDPSALPGMLAELSPAPL